MKIKTCIGLSVLSIFSFLTSVQAQTTNISGEFQSAPIAPSSRFNPDISLNGLFAAGYFSEPDPLQFGAHDPNERGFTLQNLELTLSSVVDPYFKAEVYLIFGFEDGESIVEVEEAHLRTTGLPSGLEIMAGQFFTRFGRSNSMHPHHWDFADQNIVNTLMFGAEGLRNPGVQVSVLFPLPFYLESIISIQNAKGETASSFLSSEEDTFAGRPLTHQTVHGADDLISMGRLKTAFDITETLTVVTGTSHIVGQNGTGDDTQTRIHGIDFFIHWKPLSTDHGWPFVKFQGELMHREYEAGSASVEGVVLPEESLKTTGFYLQTLYGFTRRWVAGLRYGAANATRPDDPRTGDRWRLSSNLTFYPSEFSKIRLQYHYDDSEDVPDPIHAVLLQYEFSIGAHAAHVF